jgi:hypothetical protein
MSQDLLAEFGDFSTSEGTTQNYIPTQSQHMTNVEPRQSSNSNMDNDNIDPWHDDQDDFGDFEEPEPEPEPNKQTATSKPIVKPVEKMPIPSGPPRTTKKANTAKQLPSDHPFAGHADILFDADEYDEFADADVLGSWGDVEEDDFGDFETSSSRKPVVNASVPQPKPPPVVQKNTQPRPAAILPAAVDLLAFDDPPETKAEFSRAVEKPLSTPNPPPTTISNDDTWDDFETLAPPPTEQTPQISLPTHILGDLTTQPSTPTQLPPTNIPPPSILLTLFPPLLTSLSKSFLLPLTTLTPTQKSSFLSTPQAKSFLSSYITLTHVLAHIIAGRKSRWKRDKHLAQSMRIGPASSKGSGGGGMKLAGLDKSEVAREDAQLHLVLSTWREQVGRLKSAVAVAFPAAAAQRGGAPTTPTTVPELSSTLTVRVAKQSEGPTTSLHSCALCGLKRDERVAKVDVAIQDSFGEFWLQNSNMHTACLRFWDLFKGRLMSR